MAYWEPGETWEKYKHKLSELRGKFRPTDGAEFILSVLGKYRWIVAVYLILQILSIILFSFSGTDWSLRYWGRTLILMPLPMLLPMGIIAAVSFGRERRTVAAKNALVVGGAGSALHIIWTLFSVMYSTIMMTMMLEMFGQSLSIRDLILTYIGIFSSMFSLSLTIIFLVILLFNKFSSKMGIWLCVLTIVGIIISIGGSIYFDIIFEMHDYLQGVAEFHRRMVFNQIRHYLWLLIGVVWSVIQILIAREMMRQKRVEV